MTRKAIGLGVEPGCTRFYCPYCKKLIESDTYSHSFEHQDMAPYSYLIIEEFWPVGLATQAFAEGVY